MLNVNHMAIPDVVECDVLAEVVDSVVIAVVVVDNVVVISSIDNVNMQIQCWMWICM